MNQSVQDIEPENVTHTGYAFETDYQVTIPEQVVRLTSDTSDLEAYAQHHAMQQCMTDRGVLITDENVVRSNMRNKHDPWVFMFEIHYES